MYNAHSRLLRFESKHVRVSKDERARLAEYREKNLERLKEGLEELGPMRSASKAGYERSCDQGGYAMHTLVQRPRGDYDIDTAVIFREDVLPADPLGARKRVAEALQKSAIQFKKPPEVRTNAVTVWYAEGHHIDLPVYRERQSFWGNTIEHAGSSWTKRDPGEISKWFTAQVRRHSPQKSANDAMPEDQMRRIVRYLKVFACSRESWGLPGGLLITTLVGECYRPHPARDDEALYDTMGNIARRLHGSTTVYNPADHSVQLTTKEEHHGQLRRFRERLDEARERLRPLQEKSCNEATAMEAWDWLFRHSYWEERKAEAERLLVGGITLITLDVGVAKEENGRILYSYDSGKVLAKEMHLRFRIENFPLKWGQEVTWAVENSGEEAEEAGDLSHETSDGGSERWELTRYHGDHRMVCEVRDSGMVIGRGERVIRVGRR